MNKNSKKNIIPNIILSHIKLHKLFDFAMDFDKLYKGLKSKQVQEHMEILANTPTEDIACIVVGNFEYNIFVRVIKNTEVDDKQHFKHDFINKDVRDMAIILGYSHNLKEDEINNVNTEMKMLLEDDLIPEIFPDRVEETLTKLHELDTKLQKLRNQKCYISVLNPHKNVNIRCQSEEEFKLRSQHISRILQAGKVIGSGLFRYLHDVNVRHDLNANDNFFIGVDQI